MTSSNQNTKYNFNGLRVAHEGIIRRHLDQDYGELACETRIDEIRKKYQLFPNEALYVIDCKYAQVEPLTKNFNAIVGHDGPHQNDIALLYNHIGEVNQHAVINWIETMLDGLFHEWNRMEPEKDLVSCLYQARDGKIILKSTTPLVFDSKGVMRYSMGKLTDLTQVISFRHFGYRFQGPNKLSVLNTYRKKMMASNILSARETEIIKLIGVGESSEQISHKLFISKLTVDKHRRNIIEKMETTSANEAFLKCKNLGYF